MDLKNNDTIEIDNSYTHLVEEYNSIMNGFDDANPFLQNNWEKEGDVFKKFSLYDSASVCISGLL